MGVATSLASGLPALLVGRPFMTGLWWKDGPLPVGTPLLFDVGVYLTVLGVVLGMLLALLEDASGDERPEVTPPARPENGG
jgi:multisubunit Na+/H+ antiporter MnhB subunit